MTNPILTSIDSPKDLKKLSIPELTQLAQEIRHKLINSVAETGGHLAPNLGVVELTLALHRVFDSPKDKLVWDVGHQTYVHKLLTGRMAQFSTLRQYKGMSGFPKRGESLHDCFDTGHSSTSISAALGLAKARDLKGRKYKVAAIIGDGALTGGMAFEALNHAGHLGTDIIVVLNDNEMSIAANVGALSGYLSRIRTDPKYYKGKEDFGQLLRKIPSIGPSVVKAAERIKDSFKYLVVPGMLFEEMGFTYLGPIDGHNQNALEEVLTRAKSIKGPVLVHAITKKGRGYEPAERDPDKFHGIGPFDVASGETLAKPTKPSYTQVFGDTLVKLAQEDEKILAITAAMLSGTGLKKFAGKFPDRFLDVGIAEQHAITMAAGLALEGFKPVNAIYSTFLQRAYDQIVHDVCLQNLPVTFAIDRAGIVGDDGASHQGIFDYAYLRHIPNMTIMAPKDENELQHMLKTAINYPGPVSVRYPRGQGVGIALDETIEVLPIGKGEVLKDGKDLTILAVGSMVYPALEAGRKLADLGINAAVINARFVKPLDQDLIIEYATKTGKLVTVEEHVLDGGFGSAVLELLEANNLQTDVKRMGIANEFVEHGSTDIFLNKYSLTSDGITKTVLEKVSSST